MTLATSIDNAAAQLQALHDQIADERADLIARVPTEAAILDIEAAVAHNLYISPANLKAALADPGFTTSNLFAILIALLDKRYPTLSIPTATDVYVDPVNGNDAATGLDQAHPRKSLASTLLMISKSYLTFDVMNVHVANGNTDPINIQPSLVAQWNIVGNSNNPSLCSINSPNAATNLGRGVSIGLGTRVTLDGFAIQSLNECIDNAQSYALLQNLKLLGSANNLPLIGSYVAGTTQLVGKIEVAGNGSYVLFSADSSTGNLGYADSTKQLPLTVTLTGNPTFSGGFVGADNGSSIRVLRNNNLVTINGGAHGKRFNATAQSRIIVGDGPAAGGTSSFLAGDVAGTVDATSVYI